MHLRLDDVSKGVAPILCVNGCHYEVSRSLGSFLKIEVGCLPNCHLPARSGELITCFVRAIVHEVVQSFKVCKEAPV
jgi:hypothetical protein